MSFPIPHFSRPLGVLAGLLALLAATGELIAQPTGGPEQQINVTTADNQRWPAVDMADDGAFVVAWQDESGLDGSGAGIVVRRYSSSGVALGSELVANANTAISQVRPDVAMVSDGGFIAVWDEFQTPGGDQTRHVVGRRFDASGSPLGGDFVISAGASGTGPSSHARIAVARSLGPSLGGLGTAIDSSVVVWQRFEDSGRRNVYARRFDASGSALGAAFRVNTTTSQDQERPDIAVAEDGSFVVVWDSYAQDDVRGVYAQRYDTAGAAVGGELRVHQRIDDGQCCASVAPLENGGYVFAYEGDKQDGDGRGVFARFMTSGGLFTAAEVQVNVTTGDHQGYPSVTVEQDGEVIVAWQSAGQDGDGRGVYARRFSAAGLAIGGEIQLPITTSGDQDLPAVAKNDGDFIAVWRTYKQDGDDFGIAGRLFTTP